MVLGVLAAAAFGTPSAAGAQTPDRDSVIGAGHVLATDFVVSVQNGQFGLANGVLNATGFVEGTAYATCLNVSGNRAVAAYRFVDGPNAGRGFISEVVDNGPPVNGQPVDITTYNGYVDPDPPSVCPAPGQGPPAGFQSVGAGPLTSGDVTVHDAPGLPAAGNDGVAGVARECLQIDPTQPFCDRTFFFEALADAGPSGENPRGYVDWYDAGPSPGASSAANTTVTCLSVHDRVAIIGVTGQWERFGVSDAVFPIAGLIRVVDAGGPDSDADTVQFAIQMGPKAGSPLPGPTSCSTFPGGFPTGIYAFPDIKNEMGDLVVVDTRPPLPTSKDQCKNGGWRSYGVFKNQGDCVSFVATGGKNPPGKKAG
jgi:hypothetical protein